MGANADRLRREGLIEGDLPDEYIDFLETLSQTNVDDLVTLKRTLEGKEIKTVPIRLKEKGWLQIFAVTKSMPVL
jgi:hypothetical protein